MGEERPLLYWYRNMRDPVTLPEEVWGVPMWTDQGCFKPPYQLQQVCQTVTAYWSTDKGCLCGRGLVLSPSVMKICLFFKASLATLKSTTTARRPHRSLQLTIRSLNTQTRKINSSDLTFYLLYFNMSENVAVWWQKLWSKHKEEEIRRCCCELLLAAFHRSLAKSSWSRWCRDRFRVTPQCLKKQREGNRQEDVVVKSSVFVNQCTVSLWAFGSAGITMASAENNTSSNLQLRPSTSSFIWWACSYTAWDCQIFSAVKTDAIGPLHV